MIASLLLLHALAGPPDGSALTPAQLRAMSSQELARRLLGSSATEAADAIVYAPEAVTFTGEWRLTVAFVEKPRSSGFAGICEADTTVVTLHPIEPLPRDTLPGDETPMAVAKVEKLARFRIIGHAPGGPVADAAGRARLQTTCAAAGPVLDPEHYSWSKVRFFPVYDGSAGDLDVFVRALRTAQRDARRAEHLPECQRDALLPKDPMCRDPSAALARVDWRRLEGVSLYTDPGKPPQMTHAVLYFRRDRHETLGADHVHVEIAAFVNDGDPQIESIKIAGVTYVD